MYIDVGVFSSHFACLDFVHFFATCFPHEITDRGACSAGRVNPLIRVLLHRVRPVALTSNAGTISAALTAMVVVVLSSREQTTVW